MANNNENAIELKGILGEINTAMKEMEASNKRIKDGFSSTKESLSGLVDLATQFAQHQDDSSKLSSDQLESLSKKFQIEKENLKLSQESLAAQIQRTQNERTASNLEKRRLTILQQTQGYNRERQQQIDKLNKSSNDLTQSISQQQIAYEQANDVLVDTDDSIKNLEKGLVKAAEQAKLIKIGKDIGGELNKISTPIDDYLSIWSLINKVIQFVIGGVIEYDKRLGDTAKTMSMTYDEADKSNRAMISFIKSTGNAVIASKELNKTVTDLNVQLGSAIKFENLSTTLKKDVALMAELETYAGMTAEETQGILNYTLATGQEATKATKQLMANYKVAGLKKGIVLNEKDAMKEIANLSNSIKLSTAGGAAGLAKALGAAKALGTSLNKVDDIAGSILNFEESIEAELSAELLLGKDLNLEKAREAALNNDLEALSNEIAKNVGSAAEFAGMNRIAQEAIAKAVGMSRNELADTLSTQEALKNISADSIEQAQELYNIAKKNGTEKEFLAKLEDESLGKQLAAKNIADEAAIKQGQMTDGIISSLDAMKTYKDQFKQILDFVMKIVNNFELIKGIMIAIGAIMAAKLIMGIWKFASGVGAAIKAAQALQATEKMGAIAAIVRGAWTSMGPIPFVGAALATAAVVGGVGYLISQMNDGIISPSTGGSGYGSRVLHGPEGAISFNNKDTIVAGTDLFKANDMVSAPKGTVQIASNNDSSKDIAELKSAILALASRPVDVAIDGKKVIEATTGANPNTQGLESAKNSFKMQ